MHALGAPQGTADQTYKRKAFGTPKGAIGGAAILHPPSAAVISSGALLFCNFQRIFRFNIPFHYGELYTAHCALCIYALVSSWMQNAPEKFTCVKLQ